MNRKPRSRVALLMAVVFASWIFPVWRPFAPAPGWQLSVEVAQVRVSFGTVVAPVRNRTPMFEIGQIVGWIGSVR